MRLEIEKVGGILFAEPLEKTLNTLGDGKYIIRIMYINDLKTPEDCRKYYFSLVDECVKATGHTRYEIHEFFKEYKEIETTKDMDSEDWHKFIDSFRGYAYDKMNVYL